MRDAFLGGGKYKEISSSSPCFEPFYNLNVTELTNQIVEAAPVEYDIKYNARYYLEGMNDFLRIRGKRLSLDTWAEYPPVTIFNAVDDMQMQAELDESQAQQISVTKGIVSGNDYAMYIDKWPERAENIYVCYKYDSYPRDYNDCDGCSIVTRNKFNSSNCLWIQQIHSEKYYVTFFREMLGKFMPIGNYTFDCGRRYEITCQFEKIGIFGKNVAIRFKSKDTDYIPELKFAVANGRVPLSINSASEVITIPEQQNFKGESVVKVEGFTLKKNYYGKLFCDNRKFTLIVSGDSKMA